MSLASHSLTSAPLRFTANGDAQLVVASFPVEQVSALAGALNELVRSFKNIRAQASVAADGDEAVGAESRAPSVPTQSQTPQRRQLEPSLEYEFESDDHQLRLSMTCNPNLFSGPFNAQVYIVLDDGRVRCACTAPLTEVIECVKKFKSDYGLP